MYPTLRASFHRWDRGHGFLGYGPGNPDNIRNPLPALQLLDLRLLHSSWDPGLRPHVTRRLHLIANTKGAPELHSSTPPALRLLALQLLYSCRKEDGRLGLVRKEDGRLELLGAVFLPQHLQLATLQTIPTSPRAPAPTALHTPLCRVHEALRYLLFSQRFAARGGLAGERPLPPRAPRPA